MNQNKLSWLLLLAVMLLQASCTSQLYIERVLPPEVPVSDKQWKVMVMNRYNPDLLPFKREKKVEVYADGAMHAYEGILDAIDADMTFVLEFADSAAYLGNSDNKGLTPAQVREIYSTNPHHLLLTLDNFDTFFEQDVVREKDEDGDISKTAHYTLITKSSWTLYDSTGAVLDRATLTRDEYYNSRGVISGLLAIGPSISNAGTTINYLARQTGLDYWQRLSPQPISFVRPYYSNKAFAPAAQLMAVGNWTEAIELLKPLTEAQKKKDAAKAAYNLAVVYEAMGQIEDAKHWAKVASSKNNKLALLLLPDLQRY